MDFELAKRADLPPEVAKHFEDLIRQKYPNAEIHYAGDVPDWEMPPELHAGLASLLEEFDRSLKEGTCRDCLRKIPMDHWPPNPGEPIPEGWGVCCAPNDTPLYLICDECDSMQLPPMPSLWIGVGLNTKKEQLLVLTINPDPDAARKNAAERVGSMGPEAVFEVFRFFGDPPGRTKHKMVTWLTQNGVSDDDARQIVVDLSKSLVNRLLKMRGEDAPVSGEPD